VRAVSKAVDIPTLVGSGITADNLERYHSAGALIVGSSVKRDGWWGNPVDEARAGALARNFRRACSS